nr:hypothetical protein [Tanacetum cinerariifolium]
MPRWISTIFVSPTRPSAGFDHEQHSPGIRSGPGALHPIGAGAHAVAAPAHLAAGLGAQERDPDRAGRALGSRRAPAEQRP